MDWPFCKVTLRYKQRMTIRYRITIPESAYQFRLEDHKIFVRIAERTSSRRTDFWWVITSTID